MYDLPENVCVVPVIPVLHLRCSFDTYYLSLCMSEVIYSFRSLRVPHVISLCDFAYYVVGKSLQLLRILPFGILCLYAIRMLFAKIVWALCMLIGIAV